MPTSKAQARELSMIFLDLSNSLQKYRIDEWDELTAAQHKEIGGIAWSLHNYSDDFTTTAVGLALNDLEADLEAIRRATAKAKRIVATIETVKDIITVASAVVVLGGAIASKNPAAIAKAAKDLFDSGQEIAKAARE
jgi:hypothetical protein